MLSNGGEGTNSVKATQTTNYKMNKKLNTRKQTMQFRIKTIFNTTFSQLFVLHMTA